MTWAKILAELKSRPTVSVPIAGQALGELSRNSAYAAARNNELGVPVIKVGGKRRVSSAAVLRKLGLAESGEAA